MPFSKKIKDQLIRLLAGPQHVPRGLFEMDKYFRNFGPIEFDYKEDGGSFVAISRNFRYGSIIAQGKDKQELEEMAIPDAILTAFEVPSSYAEEAGIHKIGEHGKQYAIA